MEAAAAAFKKVPPMFIRKPSSDRAPPPPSPRIKFACKVECSVIDGAGNRKPIIDSSEVDNCTRGDLKLTAGNLLIMQAEKIVLQIPVNEVQLLNARGPSQWHLQHFGKGIRYLIDFPQVEEAKKFSTILEELAPPFKAAANQGQYETPVFQSGQVPPQLDVKPKTPMRPAPVAPSRNISPKKLQDMDKNVHYESIVTAFQEAIAKGNAKEAADMAAELAKGRVKLNCFLLSVGAHKLNENSAFSVNVHIEDSILKGPKLKLQVHPGMTIFALKVKMFLIYNFPLEVQRFIIGKKIPKENETLKQNGITTADAPLFLYLVNPETIKLTESDANIKKQQLQAYHNDLQSRGELPDMVMTAEEYENYMEQDAKRKKLQQQQRSGQPGDLDMTDQKFEDHNYIRQQPRSPQIYDERMPYNPGPSHSYGPDYHHGPPYASNTLPLRRSSDPRDGQRRSNTLPHHRREVEERREYDEEDAFYGDNLRQSPGGHRDFTLQENRPSQSTAPSTHGQRGPPRDGQMRMPPLPAPPRNPELPQWKDVGWFCEKCTFINPPTIPACRSCLGERPETYKAPPADLYIMDPAEKMRYDEMQQNEALLRQWQKDEKKKEQDSQVLNLNRLMEAAQHDIIPNEENFDCPICFTDIKLGEGVRLRECLHQFCKECLQDHINLSTDPAVKCPHADDDYACDQVILDREIKKLISEEDYNRYLQRGLNSAEAAAPDTFHCKTPNCPGLCFYDDENNFFDCDVCGHSNCLTCKDIHEGINCKQYQEELKIKAGNDEAAKKTHEALMLMLQSGEAMHCPQCGIIIQKKTGCDWLQCSICKTEICWVTKGRRWGPTGHGDTSGGCQCNVNGKKCNPKCGNCH